MNIIKKNQLQFNKINFNIKLYLIEKCKLFVLNSYS